MLAFLREGIIPMRVDREDVRNQVVVKLQVTDPMKITNF